MISDYSGNLIAYHLRLTRHEVELPVFFCTSSSHCTRSVLTSHFCDCYLMDPIDKLTMILECLMKDKKIEPGHETENGGKRCYFRLFSGVQTAAEASHIDQVEGSNGLYPVGLRDSRQSPRALGCSITCVCGCVTVEEPIAKTQATLIRCRFILEERAVIFHRYRQIVHNYRDKYYIISHYRLIFELVPIAAGRIAGIIILSRQELCLAPRATDTLHTGCQHSFIPAFCVGVVTLSCGTSTSSMSSLIRSATVGLR